jgi:ATP-dependent Clp protease ATP-binding subunit ClpC
MLERLGADAKTAVALARSEAASLGHRQIGTEHLLLGLLGTPSTTAARALTASGASLVSARQKVREALATRAGGAPVTASAAADLPFSDRAARVLDRAGRLALRTGHDQAGCDHILTSLIDVEGTAGQVLRGLGVDPDAVKTALAAPDPSREPSGRAADDVAPAAPATPPASAPVRCGHCSQPLEANLGAALLTAASTSAAVEVFYCTACGSAIGTGRVTAG